MIFGEWSSQTHCTDLFFFFEEFYQFKIGLVFFSIVVDWEGELSIASFGLAEYFIIDGSTTEHGIVAAGVP